MNSYEMMVFMGEGYGLALEEIRQKKIIETTLKRLGGDCELIERYAYDRGMSDPDWDYSPMGMMTEGTNKTTLRAILEEEFECNPQWGKEEDQFNHLNDLNDVANMIADQINGEGCGFISLLTPEDDEKSVREARRKQLESVASQVARRHNVRVDSLAFIEAIHKELDGVRHQREQWDNPEAQMERQAACVMTLGSARGADVYYDDESYVGGQFSDQTNELYEILDWIAESCPLLWAQYQETKVGNEKFSINS